MKYTALIYGLLLFLCSACGQKTEVTSPDGKNKLVLMLDESGSLYYQIFSGIKQSFFCNRLVDKT